MEMGYSRKLLASLLWAAICATFFVQKLLPRSQDRPGHAESRSLPRAMDNTASVPALAAAAAAAKAAAVVEATPLWKASDQLPPDLTDDVFVGVPALGTPVYMGSPSTTEYGATLVHRSGILTHGAATVPARSDVLVVLTGGARTIDECFDPLVNTLIRPLGNADVYAVLKLFDPGPKNQTGNNFEYQKVGLSALKTTLGRYENVVGLDVIKDEIDDEDNLLATVKCRKNFQGFLGEDAHLSRAMVTSRNVFRVIQLLKALESARGKAYKYVVTTRPDVAFQDETARFEHWSRQTNGAFSWGLDWGYFAMREDIELALSSPFKWYSAECISPRFRVRQSNEEIVRSSVPTLGLCARSSVAKNDPCLIGLLRDGGANGSYILKWADETVWPNWPAWKQQDFEIDGWLDCRRMPCPGYVGDMKENKGGLLKGQVRDPISKDQKGHFAQ